MADDSPETTQPRARFPGTPVGDGRSQIVVVNLLPTALMVLAVVILWRALGAVRDALLLLTLSALLSSALNPLVSWLQGRGRLPRTLAAMTAVFVPLLLLVVAGALLAPPLSAEVGDFLKNLPDNLTRLQKSLEPVAERYSILQPLTQPNVLQQFSGDGGRMASGAVTLAGGVVRLLGALIFLVVLVLYTLVRPEPLMQGILTAVPEAHRERARSILERTLRDLGAWGRSTLVLMLAVGSLTVIGLSIIGVPNALLFGLVAAVGEGIPTVGPILAAVPPLLAMLATDPGKAIWVVVVATAVQQLENNLLVPLVYGTGVRLHPVSVMAGVLVFGSLFGVVGAFMAVPLVLVIKAIYDGVYLVRRERVREGDAREMLGEP